MEQLYQLPAQRVSSLDCRAFTQVAGATCECEVVQIISATPRRRQNVFHFELEVEHALRSDAELASVTCTTSYRKVVPMRHRAEAAVPPARAARAKRRLREFADPRRAP
jgi:hypothetical protein